MSNLAKLANADLETNCTVKCKSKVHANIIHSAVTKVDDSLAKAFCLATCRNFWRVWTAGAKNLIHWTASIGKPALLEWLLLHAKVDINHKDTESGYSALHRAFLYANLECAQILIEHGASLACIDYEGLNPVELIHRDKFDFTYDVENSDASNRCRFSVNEPTEVYSYGENTCYNLGHSRHTARQTPEPVDFFRRQGISLKQISMSKFHTLFLAKDGRVFSCGHGLGGRLGLGHENPQFAPHQIDLSNERCIMVAAGQDHSLFVTESGQAFSCGSNIHRQLGQPLELGEIQTQPKSIAISNKLKMKPLIGCAAGSCHSVLYSSDVIFTFGLNAGHLGHRKEDGPYISQPKQISFLKSDCDLLAVKCSDAATGVSTAKGDVWILYKFEDKQLLKKQLDLRDFEIFGGQLDTAGIQMSSSKENIHPLLVATISRSGKVCLWTEDHPQFRRCVFQGSPRLLYPTNISLFQSGLLLITPNGFAYRGAFIKSRTPTAEDLNQNEFESAQRKFSKEQRLPLTPLKNLKIEQKRKESPKLETKEEKLEQKHRKSAFVSSGEFLDFSKCQMINVHRIPSIFRGIFCQASPDGRNSSFTVEISK